MAPASTAVRSTEQSLTNSHQLSPNFEQRSGDIPGREMRHTTENRGNVANQALRQTVIGGITINQNEPEPDLHRLLPAAEKAAFNSYGILDSSYCLPETRKDVLAKIITWADGYDEKCIFWLNGMAGTGKSTVARTVARHYYSQKRLGASFFFSRGGGDVSRARMFFTTIARQLMDISSALKEHIREAVAQHNSIVDLTHLSLRDQWEQLILQPLSMLKGDSCPLPLVLVVDALDECDGDERDDDGVVQEILQLFTEAKSLGGVRLRVFLTGRPETPIRHGFSNIPEIVHHDFVLHEISQETVNYDIRIFFERRLAALGRNWLNEQTIELLVQSASGLFIWAATACRFISEAPMVAEKRISLVLRGGTSTASGEQLNKIYVMILTNCVGDKYSEEEKEELHNIMQATLGTIVVLFSPLSVESLAGLVHMRKEDIEEILANLHSILDVPKGRAQPIRLLHPSFRDFLLDETKPPESWFRIDEKTTHSHLFSCCLDLMEDHLRKDMCDLRRPGALNSEVEKSKVESCLPPAVQYACHYWVAHLQGAKIGLCDDDRVHKFLQKHLLHWLEALSLMRKTSEGVLAIISLESIVIARESPGFHAFIYDAKRFALYNRSIIEEAPLQIYCSALIFAPEMSIIRGQFKDQIPHWIYRLPKMQRDWSSLELTLEGYTAWVYSAVFSPDGSKLASASRDGTVRVWNVTTGQTERTLEGHTDSVNSAVFSPDSSKLASASHDRTVRVWNVTTGQAERTLEGHTHWVNSAVFSPDGSKLASASHDRTVRVWNVTTGQTERTLEGHTDWVNSAVFSPDGSKLASASRDGTVRVWNVATGQAERTLKGHMDSVNSVVSSPDGSKLASVSRDLTVRVWNVTTGQAERSLKGHTDWVNSAVFSPDGSKLASASDDRTVRVWNVATGQAERTLEGHTNSVSSAVFSLDGSKLASSSHDGTVRVWNIAIGQAERTLEGHTDLISSAVFSPDGSKLASASFDRTVRVWNVTTGQAEYTLEGHTDSVNNVAFSPNGSKLASVSDDRTVRVWNITTGQAERTLKGHTGSVNSVLFSGDGSKLVSASRDKTVRVWNIVTGQAERTLEGHTASVSSAMFSPDGSKLASISSDKTVRVWNVATGQAERTLKGHTGAVNSALFSPDGSKLASASRDGTVRVWNVATGQAERTLEGHTDSVYSAVFSPDSSKSHSFYSLDMSRRWVTQNRLKILYLPVDYRPGKIVTEGSILAIGAASGRVTIIVFRPEG